MVREILNLPSLPSKMTVLQLVRLIYDKQLHKLYPNLWIAERSFSKLELTRTYLRFMMTQECLNGLSLISIDRDHSQQLTLLLKNAGRWICSNTAGKGPVGVSICIF